MRREPELCLTPLAGGLATLGAEKANPMNVGHIGAVHRVLTLPILPSPAPWVIIGFEETQSVAALPYYYYVSKHSVYLPLFHLVSMGRC